MTHTKKTVCNPTRIDLVFLDIIPVPEFQEFYFLFSY